MDFKRIIENGYGKLAEMLPEREKGFLEGLKYAAEELENFKSNMDDFIEQDVPTLRKIEEELTEIVIDNAIGWLECAYDENLVSCVDNNHYSIDENGNIIDDNEI